MASISRDWPKDRDLPQTLQELLKETVINNSFKDKDVTDQLISTMESAYAHLYRYQKDIAPFTQFHYQTREYLLNATHNEIENRLREYRNELAKVEEEDPENTERITELKRAIAEVGEVRFGDLFLDDRRRMAVEVPFDIIETSVRETYRRGPLYRKSVTLIDIAENNTLFYRIPIAILDNKVRSDILVTPTEKGTTITFLNSKASDLYNKQEAQQFHDVSVIFVENIFFVRESIVDMALRKINTNSFEIPFEILPIQQRLITTTKDREGIFFCGLEDESRNYSHMMECTVTETGITFEGNVNVRNMINRESTRLVVSIWFYNSMYRHTFYQETGDVSPFKLEDPEAPGGYRPESGLFIPLDKDAPFNMPIPEDKFLIMKRTKADTKPITDVEYPIEYRNTYGLGITMYYPNFYQVTDSNMGYNDKYRVYFCYRRVPGLQYTPLTNYYTDYLRLHYNNKYPLEQIFNMIYFRLQGYDKNFYMIDNYGAEPVNFPGLVEGHALIQFYSVFKNMMDYKDYDYMYGTPDFLREYDGNDVPLQYKIAKMREFVRADYHTLQDYVNREQDKTKLYHFFVDTIELRDRFRRSTRKENPHKKMSFARDYEIVAASKMGSLKVVDNNDYNPAKEIHIEDVRLHIPGIELGQYVYTETLIERYVFGFKNDESSGNLPIKIYVDGLLTVNYEMINVFGMEYIYIPTHLITPDSYIMVEIDTQMDAAQKIDVEFPDEMTAVACHFINTPGLTYTMNDVVLRNENNDIIDRSEYGLSLVKGNIDYSMVDERNGHLNEFGAVTDIEITMKKGPFPRKASVVLNKVSFISSVIAEHRGYYKFDIKSMGVNPDSRFLRLYYNGRLIPPILYKTVKEAGTEYIQTRILCRQKDEFLFEYAPYAKKIIAQIDEVKQNEPFDFSRILDKPADPNYYEFFVNGRRLGIANVFPFGPHHAVFRGLVSKYMLDVYEKERDFEYFGYKMVQMDKTDTTYHYYFEPMELVKSKFMTKEEKQAMIDAYVDRVKAPGATIVPNVEYETGVEYTIASDVIADLQGFYFEEILPLTQGDPNKNQFLTEFLEQVYPCTLKVYGMEDLEGGKMVYMDPNIAIHTHDPKEQKDCGEDQILCAQAKTCEFSTKEHNNFLARREEVRLFFEETIYDEITARKYPGVVRSDYSSSLKIQAAWVDLVDEMDYLEEQLVAFRVPKEETQYPDIRNTAIRCDDKLVKLLNLLNDIGIHLTDNLAGPYNYFPESVANLAPDAEVSAEHRCVNPQYPYVGIGEGIYDIIQTKDIDIPNSTVLLLGEEDFTTILRNEGKLDAPRLDLHATEFKEELYNIKSIYVQGKKENDGTIE